MHFDLAHGVADTAAELVDALATLALRYRCLMSVTTSRTRAAGRRDESARTMLLRLARATLKGLGVAGVEPGETAAGSPIGGAALTSGLYARSIRAAGT